ncbi:hypothetical protein BVRB_028140 [Beta vulgaris subsp. vulgaris]|uniref:Uncharacterized protein n=1 Tax=Beta vulgaris subsp. vulgaris TaxID=3555 RepID=A0A0J8DSP3_BETVV|nr:hypothetical protein BVRB_028140 [Beta vulgaris subsp. vulgaris]
MQAPNNESDASSSEDEDPEGLLLTPKIDRQIMETIEKIRNRDPAVYNPDAKFYDEDDDDEGNNDEPEPKLRKAKSVRQILAEQMIEEALNPDADEEKPQYVPANEQSRARQAFIAANISDESDDDLELIPKQRHEPVRTGRPSRRYRFR